ncbi:MAG: fumarylacetoacetate hydrolase family protein [Gemmatimonadota bacterium]
MTTLPAISLPVAGTGERFPVGRIFCVGRNYAAHAAEMGGDSEREAPFFFAKPAASIWSGWERDEDLPYPVATSELHHEVELVVALGSGAAGVAPGEALDHVWGYGVGVDLTRRDMQREAKEKRRPWALAKGFDHSAPCSALHLVSEIGHPSAGALELAVNGETRQQGNLRDQIWSVAETLAHLSSLITLLPGDLIFTGTPAGVSELRPGDAVSCRIDGVGALEFRVGERP